MSWGTGSVSDLCLLDKQLGQCYGACVEKKKKYLFQTLKQYLFQTLQWISRNLKADLLLGTYMCMIRFVNV